MTNVIENLVKTNWLRKGSVVGIAAPTRKLTQRLVVRSVTITPALAITALCEATNQLHHVPAQAIVEIDGMILHRYLEHADLDINGDPINRGKKRGRKAKIRS